MEQSICKKDIPKFINLYRSHTLLWDINNKLYKRLDLKPKAYEAIAKEMGTTVDAVKRKIRSLRGSYIAFKERSTKSMKSVSAVDKKNIHPFLWFKEMHFLDGVITTKKPINACEDEPGCKRRREDDDARNGGSADGERKNERIPVIELEKQRIHNSIVRRYMVKIPKCLLTIKTADVEDLHQRYNLLHIPSDFFLANIKWSDAFTPYNPFSLTRPCQYHIMHEMVKNPGDFLEPTDANYLFSAKVMLMSLPPIAEIYERCFEPDSHLTVHPWRLINFLVAVEGGVETGAIGGPWSPALDGENPDSDPSVLIRTAIRTCRTLTGIDLSNCDKWCRFVEMYYHRSENKSDDDYVETVVIYLPDVHSCLPSIEEWQTLYQVYKNAADNVFACRSSSGIAATRSNVDGNSNDDEMAADAAGEENAQEKLNCNNEIITENNIETEDFLVSEEEVLEEETENSAISDDFSDTVNYKNTIGPRPTHYSQLDFNTMTLKEIRRELSARNMRSKGNRNIVHIRLAKILNAEEAEESENNNKPKHVIKPKKISKRTNGTSNHSNNKKENVLCVSETANSSDKKPENICEKNRSRKDVKGKPTKTTKNGKGNPFPSSPHILVHPNRQAKDGKFDCAIKSMSALLDYHPDDLGERSFEVSLFIELFNDMLMRDFGLNIYKAIALLKDTESSKFTCDVSVDEIKIGEKIKEEAEEKNSEEEDEQETTSKKSCNTSYRNKFEKENKHNGSQSMKSTLLSIDTSSALSFANCKNLVVVNPRLLLSFVYFDTSHCGYIIDKDLEDLFYVLGLNLSRSKIRHVLENLGNFESPSPIHYRKLTHKEVPSESTNNKPKENDDVNNHYESTYESSMESSDCSEDDSIEDFNSDDSSIDGDFIFHPNEEEKEIILYLIEEYSNMPQLWDKTMKPQYDLQQKDVLLKSIADLWYLKLQIRRNLYWVKKQLTFIRKQYEKEIERQLIEINAAHSDLWFFEEMSFLKTITVNKIKHKRNTTGYPLISHELIECDI